MLYGWYSNLKPCEYFSLVCNRGLKDCLCTGQLGQLLLLHQTGKTITVGLYIVYQYGVRNLIAVYVY